VSSPSAIDIPHPFELPFEMTKQTDNVKNLMLGRVSKVKPVLKGRKITLYICASFSQGQFLNPLGIPFYLIGLELSTLGNQITYSVQPQTTVLLILSFIIFSSCKTMKIFLANALEISLRKEYAESRQHRESRD
jgi:hypothetical protein